MATIEEVLKLASSLTDVYSDLFAADDKTSGQLRLEYDPQDNGVGFFDEWAGGVDRELQSILREFATVGHQQATDWLWTIMNANEGVIGNPEAEGWLTGLEPLTKEKIEKYVGWVMQITGREDFKEHFEEFHKQIHEWFKEETGRRKAGLEAAMGKEQTESMEGLRGIVEGELGSLAADHLFEYMGEDLDAGQDELGQWISEAGVEMTPGDFWDAMVSAEPNIKRGAARANRAGGMGGVSIAWDLGDKMMIRLGVVPMGKLAHAVVTIWREGRRVGKPTIAENPRAAVDALVKATKQAAKMGR